MSTAPSIDAHLAELREPGPLAAGKDYEKDVAPRVRAYLEECRAYLADIHASSASGRIVNEANSDLIDRLIRRLFSLAEERMLASGETVETGLCVVAVGGYARREMSIHSDVDLLVLYRDELTPYVASIAERLQYWLWDAGLTVGCATRTIAETLSLGLEDSTVRTAVLTARFLCGDGVFFQDFADAIRSGLVADTHAFIVAQVENQRERHSRYGESLFLLQPNVKEGAGGLRDYHTAYWAMRAAQPSARGFDDLLHFGLLTEGEMRDFRGALDFLCRVRNTLHLITRRHTDQMSFELQEQVAEALGYGSSQREGEGELPVEKFMRDYYRSARAIQTDSELVIEQCVARSLGSPPPRDVREVEEGFRLTSGHLEIPHGAHLREKPVRLLQAFAVAQRYDVPLSRMARRLVRENLDVMDDTARRSPECSAVFMDILGAEKRVTRSLMEMNEVGLLAAFLPEWEHIVCRWQHVTFHTYTVDVHSIFLVEELRRLWRGKYQETRPVLSELIRETEDRPLLFLGCLLHDIGKGFGGNHSNRGADRAVACLERLGLPEETKERILFLIRQHLLMSHLAQRRDLSDPKLILEFAETCGDRTNLRNLYLLTFADIRASSADAWTDWKGQLIRELFERTSEFLETGADNREKAVELIEKRVDVRREGARAELLELGIDAPRIDGFFDDMPRRYFISHTPRQIARHARVVMESTADRVLTAAFKEMRGDFTEFILCTRDQHGLYAKVCGALTALGINILGSHVYTSRSGNALEIYRLTTPAGGRAEIDLAWKDLEKTLSAVLAGEVDPAELLGRRRQPVGRVKPASRREARVSISNTESDFYTIVDVMADDRIGLLYSLTETIARYGLEIYISKAATVLDQVTDTFYVKDEAGRKIRDEAFSEKLQTELLRAARGQPDLEDG